VKNLLKICEISPHSERALVLWERFTSKTGAQKHEENHAKNVCRTMFHVERCVRSAKKILCVAEKLFYVEHGAL